MQQKPQYVDPIGRSLEDMKKQHTEWQPTYVNSFTRRQGVGYHSQPTWSHNFCGYRSGTLQI